MAQFRFEAVDPGGRRQRGVTSSASIAALEAALERRQWLPIRVEEVAGPRLRRISFGSRRDLLECTRSLSALLSAGLPLARSLQLTESNAGGSLAPVLANVRAAVGQGAPLAVALEAHPEAFPPLYRGLVRAGEKGGELAPAFERLLKHLEREEETRGRILSASIYPLILVSVGGLCLLIALLWMVPRFASLVTESGAELPPMASALAAVSGLTRRFGPILALVGGAGLVAGSSAVSTGGGRRALALLVLRVPVLADLRRQVLGARFARMFGTLLAGGAPVLTALQHVVESVDDPALKETVGEISVQVREGERLTTAVASAGLFPPLLVQLFGVGEDAGRLTEFVLKAADILEDRAQHRVQRAVAFIEPTVIVAFGGLIALVAAAMLQAVYGVNAGAFR